MNAIQLMIDEHKVIKRVLTVTRKLCIGILNGSPVHFDAFRDIIDFVRNYADKHHHGKEEDVLFKKMSEELGEKMANVTIFGMLAEHELGRLFILNLENALEKVKNGDQDAKVDIIANAIAYSDLLHRHIDKEDHAIYMYAQNKLSKESLERIDEKCRELENEAYNKKIQEKYLRLANKLENQTGQIYQ
ncbi:MAG: hemerythrin domain-containing protein [Clostridia bacterium]|nr:hemerythrin domain-containing protein [Clostridia bacterium]